MSKPFKAPCVNLSKPSSASILGAGTIQESDMSSLDSYKIEWSNTDQYLVLRSKLTDHLSLALSDKTKTWEMARANLGSAEQIFAHMGRDFLWEIKRHGAECRSGVIDHPIPAVATLCTALYAFGGLSLREQTTVGKNYVSHAAPELWAKLKQKASVQITGAKNQTAACALSSHVTQMFVGVWLEKYLSQGRTATSGKPCVPTLVPR